MGEAVMLVCLVCGQRVLSERRQRADVCGTCGAADQMSTLYVPPQPEGPSAAKLSAASPRDGAR